MLWGGYDLPISYLIISTKDRRKKDRINWTHNIHRNQITQRDRDLAVIEAYSSYMDWIFTIDEILNLWYEVSFYNLLD